MRIKSINTENFRSIKKAENISLEKDITVFIGKNESGKTNVLKALESLNRDYQYKEDDLCAFSDVREDLENGRIKPEEIKIIEVEFGLDESDKKNTPFTNLDFFKVKKFYDNHYEIDIPNYNEIQNQLEKKTDGIQSAILTQVRRLRTDIDGVINKPENFSKSWDELKEALFSELIKKIEERDDTDDDYTALKDKLIQLPDKPKTAEQLIEEYTERIKQFNERYSELSDLLDKLDDTEVFLNLLPRFVYFASFEDWIQDSTTIEDIRNNPSKHRTLRNLLKIVNLDLDRLEKSGPHRRREYTEDLSGTITGIVNESWRQEKIEINVGIDSNNIFVYVKDTAGTHDPPSRRSKGFQWFFSFFINLIAETEDELKNSIILIDEPGLYLHASAQKDVLKTLEKLSQNNQIVFTTHSPFLIDKSTLPRIRVLTKQGKKKGTSIEEKFYKSADKEALEIIRAALGISLADMLFFSGKNLIVEGPSDYFILTGISEYFKRNKKSHLGDDVAIIPMMGATKIPAYAGFASAENLNFLILIDGDKMGKEVEKELIEALIEAKRIVNLKDFVDGKQEEVDIEDLFPVDFYNMMVNLAYQDILKRKDAQEIKIENLEGVEKDKIAKCYSRYFQKKSLGNFNKRLIAHTIYKHLTELEEDIDLDLFEKVISSIQDSFKS